MESHYVSQTGLEFLGLSDPPASISRVAGTTGMPTISSFDPDTLNCKIEHMSERQKWLSSLQSPE